MQACTFAVALARSSGWTRRSQVLPDLPMDDPRASLPHFPRPGDQFDVEVGRLDPEMAAPLTAADYLAARDSAMESVLAAGAALMMLDMMDDSREFLASKGFVLPAPGGEAELDYDARRGLR